MRKINYSFEQWCIDNERRDLLNRWDYQKNKLKPSEISYKSEKGIWFLCPNNKHDSELHRIDNLANGRNKTIYCNKCRSFAQHLIDKYNIDHLNKVWSIKNNASPWDYNYGTSKKAIFNCINDSSHEFKRNIDLYLKTDSCPICSKLELISTHSLGSLFPDSIKYWSEKNSKTPFDYSSCQHDVLWWKCDSGIHDDYQRGIEASKNNNFQCPICNEKVLGSKSKNIKDLTGMVFGNLVVRSLYNGIKKSSYAMWICDCSCGKTDVLVSGRLLRNGHTSSCGDKSVHYSGENNHNWKGGVTSENIKIRNSNQYNEWRQEIFKSDFYTCQCCGVHGGDLNAHHLKDFANHPDLRFDISNGITLCANCHDSTVEGSFHNLYGTHGKTESELQEYINNKRKQLGINVPFDIDEYKNGNILMPNEVDTSLGTWIFERFSPSEIRSNNVNIKSRFRNKEE